MKTLIHCAVFLFALLVCTHSKAQSAQGITFAGGSYHSGDDVEVKCESNAFYISASYNRPNGGGSTTMAVSPADVSAPSGYSVSAFSAYILRAQYTNPQVGDFIVTARDGSYSYTFTIHTKSAPRIQIGASGTPSLYANQTGSVSGYSNQLIEPYSYSLGTLQMDSG